MITEFQKVALKFEKVKEEVLKAEKSISSNQRLLKEILENAEKEANDAINDLKKLRKDLN